MGNFGFEDARAVILSELTAGLSAVDEAQARAAVRALTGARRVFCVGVGRVMLMLQAFAKRLNHLGIEAYCVGEINEPAIAAEDLLVVASGSGESAVPVAIARVAKRFGPRILYVGSNMESAVARMSDLALRIPCRTKLDLPDELPSVQPMSSMFEQALLLTLDALALMIVREQDIDVAGLWDRHANLE